MDGASVVEFVCSMSRRLMYSLIPTDAPITIITATISIAYVRFRFHQGSISSANATSLCSSSSTKNASGMTETEASCARRIDVFTEESPKELTAVCLPATTCDLELVAPLSPVLSFAELTLENSTCVVLLLDPTP